MPWQLAIALQLVFSTTYSLVYRRFAERHPGRALLTTALMYLPILLPAGILIAFFGDRLGILEHISFSFPPHVWLFLILGGLLFAGGNILAYVANTKIDAAQFSIIENVRAVATIVLSGLLLQEFLVGRQLLGIVVIIVSAVWLALGKRTERSAQLTRFSLIAMAAAILMGAGTTAEKYMLGFMSFATYLIIGWSFQTAAMCALATKQWKHTRAFLREPGAVRGVLSLGLLRTGAGIAFIWSLIGSDNSSLIASITLYKTFLVVVFGYLLLREREDAVRKWIAAGAATLGLWLLG